MSKYVTPRRLSSFLDNLKNTFAALVHKHNLADIEDFNVDTELSSTSTNPVQNKVVDAEFDAIATAMDVLEDAIDGKSDSDHTHDEFNNIKDLTVTDDDNGNVIFDYS